MTPKLFSPRTLVRRSPPDHRCPPPIHSDDCQSDRRPPRRGQVLFPRGVTVTNSGEETTLYSSQSRASSLSPPPPLFSPSTKELPDALGCSHTEQARHDPTQCMSILKQVEMSVCTHKRTLAKTQPPATPPPPLSWPRTASAVLEPLLVPFLVTSSAVPCTKASG